MHLYMSSLEGMADLVIPFSWHMMLTRSSKSHQKPDRILGVSMVSPRYKSMFVLPDQQLIVLDQTGSVVAQVSSLLLVKKLVQSIYYAPGVLLVDA